MNKGKDKKTQRQKRLKDERQKGLKTEKKERQKDRRHTPFTWSKNNSKQMDRSCILAL